MRREIGRTLSSEQCPTPWSMRSSVSSGRCVTSSQVTNTSRHPCASIQAVRRLSRFQASDCRDTRNPRTRRRRSRGVNPKSMRYRPTGTCRSGRGRIAPRSKRASLHLEPVLQRGLARPLMLEQRAQRCGARARRGSHDRSCPLRQGAHRCESHAARRLERDLQRLVVEARARSRSACGSPTVQRNAVDHGSGRPEQSHATRCTRHARSGDRRRTCCGTVTCSSVVRHPSRRSNVAAVEVRDAARRHPTRGTRPSLADDPWSVTRDAIHSREQRVRTCRLRDPCARSGARSDPVSRRLRTREHAVLLGSRELRRSESFMSRFPFVCAGKWRTDSDNRGRHRAEYEA